MKSVCLTLLSAAAFAGAATVAAEADPCIDFGPNQCKENAACRWSKNERDVELGRKDAVHKGGEKHGQGCHMVHAYYRDPKHGHEEIVKAVEALGMGTDIETMACSEAFGLKDCKDINQAGGKTKCSWACDPDTYAGSCVDQTADNNNFQKCGPGEYSGDCSECTHGILFDGLASGQLGDTLQSEHENTHADNAEFGACMYYPAEETIYGFDYGDYDNDNLCKNCAGGEQSPGGCFSSQGTDLGGTTNSHYKMLCFVGATGDPIDDAHICGRGPSDPPYILNGNPDGFGIGVFVD